MKWVLNENKKLKKYWILYNIILITFDCSTVIPSILLGYIVDEGLLNQNYNLILKLGIFLIIFIIIRTIGSYVSVIKLDNTCFKMASNIKEKCYKKLDELDNNFYKSKQQGELMTILTSDIGEIRRHSSYTFKTAMNMIIRFIVSIIFLFSINPLFTTMLLIPTPFILLFVVLFKNKTKPLYNDVRNKLADLNNYIQDNIEGNKVVKAFSKENDEIKNMDLKNKSYKDTRINANMKRDFYFSFVNFFTNSMTVILVLVGGYLLINNQITFGNLIVFQTLLSSIKEPFLRLGDIVDRIQNFNISKDRIVGLLNEKPTINKSGNKVLPTLNVPIKFDNVTLKYDEQEIIKNVSLTIEPGTTVAFIGPTGSGKSSIANLILRFVEESSGSIFIDNINIKDIDVKWLRSKIGYVVQQPFLFSDTILNNICYGNDNLTIDEIEKISKASRLTYVDKLEDKYETIIGERGVGLSGGEKQRLSLARALAVKPELLILDDITSALDIETEKLITESIKTLDNKCTKIIIAQKIVSVKDADQIFVISDNKVLEHGTHNELLNNKKYYYEIYKIQNNIEGSDIVESK